MFQSSAGLWKRGRAFWASRILPRCFHSRLRATLRTLPCVQTGRHPGQLPLPMPAHLPAYLATERIKLVLAAPNACIERGPGFTGAPRVFFDQPTQLQGGLHLLFPNLSQAGGLALLVLACARFEARAQLVHLVTSK